MDVSPILSSSPASSTNSSAGSNDFPTDLNVGDILFCDFKSIFKDAAERFDLDWLSNRNVPGYSNDHCMMYIGNNKFIEATPYLYRPLQKEWTGVVITRFWFINLWATNITFGYVETDQNTRDEAVKWAKKRLLKPYQFMGFPNPDPNDPSDEFSDSWFCSELIWAAYWNQDVKLSVTWGGKYYNASWVQLLRSSDKVTMYSNKPPTADAGGPYSGEINQTVCFKAWNSVDFDGIIFNYTWDFGDGAKFYGTEEERVKMHIYNVAGNYTVKLTVTDNHGESHSDTTYAIITDNTIEEPDENGDYYNAISLILVLILLIILSFIALILILKKR